MRISHFSAASIVAIVAVAGCVPAPPQAPPPVRAPILPAPAAAPTPAPLAADWRDWPLTPGTWTYRGDPRGGTASFGPAGMAARLTLRCDLPARQVIVSIPGGVPSPLTVRTSSASRALPTVAAATGPAARLAATDSLLDAIGFSRGRFIVEQAAMPPLVIPAWAEIERVTEDCRG